MPDLGSSLDVFAYACSFAPAVGGPVTLTTGALTLGPYATLTGTDSFVANGLLTSGPARLSMSLGASTPTVG